MNKEMRRWIGVILLCYIAIFIGGIVGFIPLVFAAAGVMVGYAFLASYFHMSEYMRQIWKNAGTTNPYQFFLIP